MARRGGDRTSFIDAVPHEERQEEEGSGKGKAISVRRVDVPFEFVG